MLRVGSAEYHCFPRTQARFAQFDNEYIGLILNLLSNFARASAHFSSLLEAIMPWRRSLSSRLCGCVGLC